MYICALVGVRMIVMAAVLIYRFRIKWNGQCLSVKWKMTNFLNVKWKMAKYLSVKWHQSPKSGSSL